MKSATTHYAKTHLSQLLREVQAGEEYVILSGKTRVALLTAVDEVPRRRPPVGTVTSEPIRYEDDVFAPMNDEQVEAWGL